MSKYHNQNSPVKQKTDRTITLGSFDYKRLANSYWKYPNQMVTQGKNAPGGTTHPSLKGYDWRVAEMVWYLGVTTSAVNRLAASEEFRELLKYT